MSQLQLADFHISEHYGFLTPHDMGAVTLPAVFNELTETATRLSQFMISGRLRHFLDQLAPVSMDTLLPELTDAQRRLLMVRYSFIVQAYVWGEPTPPQMLPKQIAVPYCHLADAMGQFPLLPYSAYTLDNWARLEPEGDVTRENIYVLQNFLNGQDENWFIMVHVEIEAKAGPALAAIGPLLQALSQQDTPTVITQLQVILAAWQQINPVFDRMVDRCDPSAYYLRVRPYIHGWKDNPAMPQGLIYEGVEKYGHQPQSFRGQTGSQSSIVPTMDALLGIQHENDPMRVYLNELHAYRPPAHRLFIEAVQSQSTLRAFVLQQKQHDLTELYNGIVEQVFQFRSRHLEYAASYINKQASRGDGNPTDIGTGGTPFMNYLKKHRDESEKHLIRL
jgi:indoleamine 2,3-dioxygenase